MKKEAKYFHLKNWERFQDKDSMRKIEGEMRYVRLETNIIYDTTTRELDTNSRITWLLLIAYSGKTRNKLLLNPLVLQSILGLRRKPNLALFEELGLIEVCDACTLHANCARIARNLPDRGEKRRGDDITTHHDDAGTRQPSEFENPEHTPLSESENENPRNFENSEIQESSENTPPDSAHPPNASRNVNVNNELSEPAKNAVGNTADNSEISNGIRPPLKKRERVGLLQNLINESGLKTKVSNRQEKRFSVLWKLEPDEKKWKQALRFVHEDDFSEKFPVDYLLKNDRYIEVFQKMEKKEDEPAPYYTPIRHAPLNRPSKTREDYARMCAVRSDSRETPS